MKSDELAKILGPRWIIGDDGSFRKVALKARGVASNAIRKPNPEYVTPAEDAGKASDQGKCLVRITSYRRCLCDERNLFDKHFVDALVEAGVLRGDAPQDVDVRVSQEQVTYKYHERTEIIIESLL